MFHNLLPLAIASSLCSLGICAAAGAQASLPKGRTRWWSRPLVALLFFLQPIVRGLERYEGRLRLGPPTEPSRETLDSVTLRDGTGSLDEVCYWAERRVERVEFAARVIEELNRQGWPNRTDIGWSEFDVEVYGNRWSHLQLTTVSEDHPRGRQLIRCRLRARWSLQAQVAFWSLLGLDLLVIGFFFDWLNGLGLLLLTLPAFAWFLRRQKRNLQSLVIVFLDELAKQWKLIKVTSSQAGGATPTPRPEPIRVELPKPVEAAPSATSRSPAA